MVQLVLQTSYRRSVRFKPLLLPLCCFLYQKSLFLIFTSPRYKTGYQQIYLFNNTGGGGGNNPDLNFAVDWHSIQLERVVIHTVVI